MSCSNEYHFVTHWRVEGTCRDVYEVLDNPLDLPRWWPSVYLEARETGPGVVTLHTRGRLPYTLRWSFRVVDSRPPHGFTLEAWGDFDGRGIWTFAQDGGFVDIAYDWKIRAEKPLLRYFSFVLKPLFSWNHRWAMARGEESLRAELARRKAAAV